MDRFGKNEKKNSGFTLVEMCVAIVVFAILIGVSVFGILSWSAYSDYRRQNEYASTLFLAANDSLVTLKADNVLDEFITKNGVEIQPAGGIGYDKPICCAYCNRGDYGRYLANEPLTGKNAEILFLLLEDTVYEKTVLDGCIAVEFSPDDGNLFALFFSDSADEFSYSGAYPGDKKINLTYRSDENIYEQGIGFYRKK